MLWKKCEDIVFNYYNEELGKDSLCTRFIDSADINRLSYKVGKKFTAVNVSQPSDLLITVKGWTFYAEVKSTEDPVSVKSSLVKQQSGSRRRVLAAGGDYRYFIYSIHHKQWYFLKAEELTTPMKWANLERYKIDYLKEPK